MLSEAADCRRQETSGGSGDGSGFLDHHGAPCAGRQRYTQLRQNRCPGQEPVEFERADPWSRHRSAGVSAKPSSSPEE